MPSAVRCVALDAMGVLYEQAGMAQRLTHFARARGSLVDVPEARELYRRASLGQMDSKALWQALGVNPGDNDREFVAGRGLMPGVLEFLAALRAAGIPAGCITNDVAEWSALARRARGLEGELAPWVVSGEVGVRKPAQAIYDVFLSATGCEPAECLFVDDQEKNLDAAAALGFRSVWFAPRAATPQVDRQRVATFAELHQMIVRGLTPALSN